MLAPFVVNIVYYAFATKSLEFMKGSKIKDFITEESENIKNNLDRLEIASKQHWYYILTNI